MKLFLDDIRQPYDSEWIVARNFSEFKDIIQNSTTIEEISFDHDLGQNEISGHDIAKWFVNHCMDHDQISKHLRRIIVHSDNPPGRENIAGFLESARSFGVFDGSLMIIRQPFASITINRK